MEKRRAFLENTLFFGLVLALGLLGVRWLLPLLSPLLAGFFVAFVAARPARWLHRRWRLPQRGCQTALTALLYLGLGRPSGILGRGWWSRWGASSPPCRGFTPRR